MFSLLNISKSLYIKFTKVKFTFPDEQCFTLFIYSNFVFHIVQSLLSHVSRTTKNTLNRLGVFTVSSFHAYVCARSPSLLSNLLAGRGATKRRAPLLSRSNSASSRRSLHASDRENERTAKISLPDNQVR